MPTPKVTITHNSKGVIRSGSANSIHPEDVGTTLPSPLLSFVPSCIQVDDIDDTIHRLESHMGNQHPNPTNMIESWWTERLMYWTPTQAKTQPLRKWLKSVTPHGKLSVKDLRQSLKKVGSDVPSSKKIEHLLNTDFTMALHHGPTHNALTPRRIREQGFICWRHARLNGTRGSDMAPFVDPHDYPIDVQLHILKWSWFNDPSKALRCLTLFGLQTEPTKTNTVHVHIDHITHHPNIATNTVLKILGFTLGNNSVHIVRTAMYRAKKLSLGGHPITISTTPPVEAKKDSAFFLPRRRKPEALFHKWTEGIQLDEEGRYSLTPERHAHTIAKSIQHNTVYDAFAGCGGNTIAFAQQPHIEQVLSNEMDTPRSKMCQHNASIYDVYASIKWTRHDALRYFPKAAFVFVDPPWAWGTDKMLTCWKVFNQNYKNGIMKVPIDFPVPIGTEIDIYCTDNNFPSFLVMKWSSI